jgi:VanZ family protein
VVDPIAPRPPPALLRRYRIALAAQLALVALIDLGAYTGHIPTQIYWIPFYDKIMHFLLVGVFGALLDGALAHRAIVRVPFVPRVGSAITLVLAGAEEYLQRLSPRRNSSWGDLAANYAGILVCSWVLKRITMAHLERLEAKARPA